VIAQISQSPTEAVERNPWLRESSASASAGPATRGTSPHAPTSTQRAHGRLTFLRGMDEDLRMGEAHGYSIATGSVSTTPITTTIEGEDSVG
jgi:hypothetical protein